MTTINDLGIQRTRLDQRLADLVAKYQAIWGQDIDVAPESPDGQWLGVVSEMVADVDELVEVVYLGRNPSGATGASLSRLMRLTGIQRKTDQFSTVVLSLGGDGGAVVPDGSLIASNLDPTAIFKTIGDVTLVGGVGSGAGLANAIATTAGAVLAPAGSLTEIKTVISGWSSSSNLADANPGSLGEKDPQARLRRDASVAAPAQSITDGLYSTVAALANVSSAVVYENNTDAVDARGLPPHSQQVIVAGGDPKLIAQAVFLKRSVGATMVGAQTATVVDGQGFNQIIRFDRPTQRTIFVTVHLNAEPGNDVRNAIVAAIVAGGIENLKIGAGVIWASLFPLVLGVLGTVPNGPKITSIAIGLTAGPTLQQDISLSTSEIATWDPTGFNNGAIKIVTP